MNSRKAEKPGVAYAKKARYRHVVPDGVITTVSSQESVKGSLSQSQEPDSGAYTLKRSASVANAGLFSSSSGSSAKRVKTTHYSLGNDDANTSLSELVQRFIENNAELSPDAKRKTVAGFFHALAKAYQVPDVSDVVLNQDLSPKPGKTKSAAQKLLNNLINQAYTMAATLGNEEAQVDAVNFRHDNFFLYIKINDTVKPKSMSLKSYIKHNIKTKFPALHKDYQKRMTNIDVRYAKHWQENLDKFLVVKNGDYFALLSKYLDLELVRMDRSFIRRTPVLIEKLTPLMKQYLDDTVRPTMTSAGIRP